MRRFARDDAAAVSVDFVVAIPILLAVLVFTSEYGRVLQMRSVLDNAVADATRYLARAPLDGTGAGFSPTVINIAEQIITRRINANHIAVGEPVVSTVNASASSTFTTVSLTVSVGVETPAISVIALASYEEPNPEIDTASPEGAEYQIAYNQIEGFVLTATETSRHFGQ